MENPRRPTSLRLGAAATAAVLIGLLLPALVTSVPPTQAAGKKAAHAHLHKARHHHRKVELRPSYWGAWIGDQLTGKEPPWDMSAVSRFQNLVGKGLSLVAISSPFADCEPAPCSFFEFPTEAMEDVRGYGAIPFFSWASQSTSSDPSGATVMPDFQLSDVISGRYDSYVREFAEDARDWGHPFFLRYDWEMNGNWFPWGAGINGNEAGEFVAAWRHVHDLFASVGATNATWVWCPYAEVDRHFAALAPLYPGDEYVDWTCLDGFNWGSNPTNPHRWHSFGDIFGPTYRKIVKRIAPSKPMILAETASTGSERAKAMWIRDMFKQLRTNFRRVRALIWFDQIDRGIDWPLETSPAATSAFSKGIRNPAFRSNVEAGDTATPIVPPS